MVGINSYTQFSLSSQIKQTNREYNEYVKKHDMVNPKNDGNTKIKNFWEDYKGYFEFVEEKNLNTQKKLYVETANMPYSEKFDYIHQRYYDKDAPHYIGHNYTEKERQYAFYTELSYNPKKYKYNNYNLNDPSFRGIKSVQPNGTIEGYGKRLFERIKTNQAISNILEKHNISIPKDVKLTFVIEPDKFAISVEGTDDKELKSKIENALNKDENGRYLSFHIAKSLTHVDSPQLTEDIRLKEDLRNTIKKQLGYDLKKLHVKGQNLVDDRGNNVADMLEKKLLEPDSIISHLSNEHKFTVIGKFRLLARDYANGYFKNTPDQILKIDYQNGSLLDRDTTKGYGEGQREWLSSAKKKLRQLVDYNTLGNIAFNKERSKGVFLDTNFHHKTPISMSLKEESKEDELFLDAKTQRMKMAVKMLKLRFIATKVAKGEKVSKQELNFLREEDPMLYEKAKSAALQAETLKGQGENGKLQSLELFLKISQKDPIYGELLFAAYSS